MLAAEARAERVLLERIVDRRFGLEEIFQRQPMGFDEFPERERLDVMRDAHADALPRFLRAIGPHTIPTNDGSKLPI